DPNLIKIVLVNLLGNAAKYGKDNGEIRLRVARPPDALQVSVWNEGPGFPESARSRLFRRFSRIETPELMKRRGTGVGLYTSWRIIQLHGGKIDAESEEGRWAEFSFRIPQPLGQLAMSSDGLPGRVRS
ncbi:MAG: ATP-binding protein, partial [Planctomycetes bacterium]|nr:ATP-binding protein [Planctomycetota bacterium]